MFVEITHKDTFYEDNIFSLHPLKVFIQSDLSYSIKSIDALGYKVYQQTKNEKFDLCITNSAYRPSKINCKIIFVLSVVNVNKYSDIYALENIISKKHSLRVENLELPPNFDVNKIYFAEHNKINFNGCRKVVPFVIDKDNNIISCYCENDGQKFVISSINWENTELTDFAKNIDAPLPIFMDAILKYLFKEQYQKREMFVGDKLFTYYNGSFPQISFSNNLESLNYFSLSNIFKYITLTLFVLYLAFKVCPF